MRVGVKFCFEFIAWEIAVVGCSSRESINFPLDTVLKSAKVLVV